MKNPEVPEEFRTPEEVIAGQRILDNIMVPVFFESDSAEAREALEECLRILLDDPGLTVQRYQAEHVLSNVGHHGVRIDVWARDGQGRQLALELQKVTDAEIYPRAVFEGATMVVHSLRAGQKYTGVDKVIVIFFTQKDSEGEGEPVYMYESTRNGKRGPVTNAAPTYVFVNGQYRNDGTDLGRLIADIMQPDPDKMRTPVLRTRMNRIKNTPEGRAKMETALEKYIEEQELKKVKTVLFGLVRQKKLKAADAAEAAGMSLQSFDQDMRAYEDAQSGDAPNAPAAQ